MISALTRIFSFQTANKTQYLPLQEIDTITNAINFSTQDCHVIGTCDIFTTKAAGGDKKLYKNIENHLGEQYESVVRSSASLSPPHRATSDDGKGSEKSASMTQRGGSVGLTNIGYADLQSTPFGPLSKITARRTFAYLIATLNASHSDYDFSGVAKPSDFYRERRLSKVTKGIDDTLNNFRPKQSGMYNSEYLMPPPSAPRLPSVLTKNGNEVWSPRMWQLIDKEMGLKECEVYCYDPANDPFVGEDTPLWSMHYFFFNKEKKRVCYFYLRCLSIMSHSPVYNHSYINQAKPKKSKSRKSHVSVGEGAGKRASYWLGDRRLDDSIETGGYDDDDDEMILEEPEDDEYEVPHMDLDEIRSELADGYYEPDDDVEIDDEAWADEGWKPRGYIDMDQSGALYQKKKKKR